MNKIEKFFYSEAKVERDEQERRMKLHIQKQNNLLDELTGDEREETMAHLRESISEQVFALLPETDTVYSVFNPLRGKAFHAMTEPCIRLAEENACNLLMDSDKNSGCIIFVGEEMNFKGKAQTLLCQLANQADEIHLRVSVDTGEHSCTDIDGLIQIEFWFDFFQMLK